VAQKTLAAIPWFRREDWPRLLSIAADRATLPEDYDEWRVKTENLVARSEARGQPLSIVTVDIDRLIAFAADNDEEIDLGTRAAYAITEMMNTLAADHSV
jgi:hypothetical protein